MKKILILALLFLILNTGTAQAAGLVPCGGHGEAPCTFCHFFVLINNIIDFVMIKLVPTIAVLMLIIGGVMFFFAGAKPDVLNQAKGIITSVVIGIIIILSAWVIVNTVLTKVGIIDTPSILEWNKVSCPVQ
jgi:type IV secretory pathway VirB2 component (pilin)